MLAKIKHSIIYVEAAISSRMMCSAAAAFLLHAKANLDAAVLRCLVAPSSVNKLFSPARRAVHTARTGNTLCIHTSLLLQAREHQAGVVNIRSDDDLEPDELLGQFSGRDAEKVLFSAISMPCSWQQPAK